LRRARRHGGRRSRPLRGAVAGPARQACRRPGARQRGLPRGEVPPGEWRGPGRSRGYEGAIANPEGLDLEAVVRHRREAGRITGYPRARDLPSPRLALELDCDILVPAAIENVITEDNAAGIRARVIAEAANGPVTTDAE